MTQRSSASAVLDSNGRQIHKLMDMYEFVKRTISADLSVAPEYILSARHDREFVIQKHSFDGGSTEEEILYYKGTATAPDTPRSIFDADKETLTYGDVWEVFS